jgi:hypothetical protein
MVMSTGMMRSSCSARCSTPPGNERRPIPPGMGLHPWRPIDSWEGGAGGSSFP